MLVRGQQVLEESKVKEEKNMKSTHRRTDFSWRPLVTLQDTRQHLWLLPPQWVWTSLADAPEWLLSILC